MKVIFTFPGQGPQYIDMLDDLPHHDITQARLQQACEILNEDVLELDTAAALKNTRAVQLCLLMSGVIHSDIMLSQGIIPDMTCGLSIGAFAAAVVCGALDFSDALTIVALRGQLMQDAYPQDYGLSAIKGLFIDQVEAIVQQINRPETPLYLANINAEQQLVVAGNEVAMQKVIELAKAHGGGGTRLQVSVPSHCELLNKPAQELAQAMAQVSFHRPQYAYLSGSTGRVLWQADKIRDDLAMNMARQVKWNEAMLSAYQRDVRLAVECPPGSILTRLTKPVMVDGEALSVSQTPFETIQTLAKRTHQARY
ncbi:malonate decarboxylase subunit epsilon [Celerinatantimonas diazotrophica]|uniref:Malonyl CoA-acyl carrier protein transacylase n=1 Tax=Celerinatantimonas diazotrophica TaxID=412034 RepID=A0A4R1K2N8_9GAMM|nr:malonate decarboxylase subunit epsilon [Celerinatantimonas diazotrophica]TCK58107.1 malonate decarboxylase epsilon subunit [Celerinatantimonas diazotrophica]CAG9297821.1 Malonyl CoA-acyl carrier protein transacylase [Celerinatantimonas diazotrophica]